MKCLITGVTGSGKSTVGKILKSKGYKVIEIDDEPGLAEWIHKNTGQIGEYKRGIGAKWVDEHEWLLNISKLRELLAKATQPTFVCGLTANQLESLYLFDKVFLLQIPANILKLRLQKRTGPYDFGEGEDEIQQVLSWHKQHEQDMIGHGAIPIDAQQAPEIIAEEILKQLDL